MKLILILFGVFLMLAGIIFVISPGLLMDFLTEHMYSPSLYVSAILIRFLLGSLLILTARQSRYPVAMKVIGVIAIVAATVFIIIGPDAFGEMMSTLVPLFKPYGEITGIVVFIIGCILIYAYTGKNEKK